MNFKEKKTIQGIVSTVLESISYTIENINYLNQSLDDCIYASNMIINFLFKEDNEEYYDIILKLNQCLDLFQKLNNNYLKEKEIITKLNVILEIINNLYVEFCNLKVKRIVLFMPYKASMWTSLESIWKAACDDPNCNPMVVLLPYYELDEMGNKQKLCYEIEQFDKGINIINYKDIDLSKIRPDAIFIHNPYDGDNNLTRIPKEFYINNLKKYSQCVIYSPYFTLGPYGKTHKGIQYRTPGTYSVDKIIVQSKRVAEIFESYNHPKDQMIISGTPKTDAIVKRMRESVEIPKEWEEKLKGKKIFLLNTHLLYLPQGYFNPKPVGDYAQRRHREIISAFVNREDCALIWRPHPLLRTVIETRFTECLPFLDEMEKIINNSSNCVIDNKSDYSISFNLSSAMISTYSSLINEYMITEKPVLIFQTAPNEEDAKISPVNYLLNYFRFAPDNITFNKFREMVLNDEDPKKEERIKMIRNSFLNLDGTAGREAYRQVCYYLDEVRK